ncbi:hypothetical protein J437_LFUL018116, partial [Ladona fulva]
MSTKRKCKALSILEKRKIIEEVEKGIKKKKDIAAEFGIPANTLSTIIKNKDMIISATEKSLGPSRKRLKSSRFPGVEEEMVKWLKTAVVNNSPISAQILREKAEQFALQLGHSEFKASSGWLDKFKNRNGMVNTHVSMKSAAKSASDCDNWKKDVLPQLLQTFNPSDIFNVDETLLYFKAIPDKTMDFTNDKGQVGKSCRDRVTILMCTNVIGTQKLKLVVIGKSKKPRCFTDFKSLPVFYESNKKSQMTSNIFESWLQEIDQRFLYEKRNILLFAENNPLHKELLMKELFAVKCVLLPRNITSKLFSMDHGLIKSLKYNYRKGTVLKMLRRIEVGEIFDITLLDCILELDKAWHDISTETIYSCFKKVDLYLGSNKHEERIKDDIPLSDHEWSNFKRHADLESTFDEYANVNCDVIVTECPDTQKMKDNKDCVDVMENREENECGDESADNLPPPPPTIQEAISSFDD